MKNEEIVDNLRSIQSVALSMQSTVNDLTDSLRISKKGFFKTEENFNIDECMAKVFKTNFNFAKSKGTKLKLNVLEDMPCVLVGDKNRIT